jgi:DNA-binding transcriptional regulator LsrR (DeoR family)
MPRKKVSAPRDRALDAKAVAWLTTRDVPQAQIAERLDISQSEVSRLKGDAKKSGWLRTSCHLTEEDEQEVRTRIWTDLSKLQDRLSKWASGKPGNPFDAANVRVFDSGVSGTGATDFQSRLERFGAQAADRLAELAPRMSILGVAWGKTVARLVESLHGHVGAERLRGRTFVPLSGVLVNDPDISLSSTSLVTRLHRIVTDDHTEALSLAAVPARIPAKFYESARALTDDQKQTIRTFVANIPGHAAIIGDDAGATRPRKEKPFVDRMDSMITSVGCDYSRESDLRSGGRWLDEMIRTENLTKADLDRWAVGDIGGVFLTRSEKTPLADVNDRWTGVKKHHIARCARTAKAAGTPGVILAAVGKWKARIVERCVREGLVNHLLIDRDLAAAIVQLPPEPR